MSIGQFAIWSLIAIVISLLYRKLMIQTYSTIRYDSSMLVPFEQLKDISDYRQFFGFLNKFFQDNLKLEMSTYKNLPKCSKVGPYHFIMAFSNLTEVQRDRFANDPKRLKDIIPIFADYNNAIWTNNTKGIANALANYHRLVKGNKVRKPTFFIAEDFGNLLFRVKEALSENNILKAHLLLLKKESDANLTDLELLTLNYLLARLSSYFQGREYIYTEAGNKALIANLFEEVSKLVKNFKDHPDEIICLIPDRSFAQHSA